MTSKAKRARYTLEFKLEAVRRWLRLAKAWRRWEPRWAWRTRRYTTGSRLTGSVG